MALSRLSRSIAGSVSIVTGAASGMGLATARLFADEGSRLALLDSSLHLFTSSSFLSSFYLILFFFLPILLLSLSLFILTSLSLSTEIIHTHTGRYNEPC